MRPTTDEKDIEAQRQRQAIFRTYLILATKLPPELIAPVVSHADLYSHRTDISTEYSAIRITNSPKLLLQTLPIISKTQTRFPVRKITFSITSRDQGFVAYPGCGSWTWFTCGILERSGGEIQQSRELVRNVTSADGFLTQEVILSVDSCAREEREFVRSLQIGDSVVVLGDAGHRGWTNFVNNVSVAISEAVIAI